MATKPTIGGSTGTWGVELNAFLNVSHDTDGTLNSTALGQAGKCKASGSTVFDTTMTAANTFQDLDLSSIVGENIALCYFEFTSDGNDTDYVIKPKGYGSATFSKHSTAAGFGSLGVGHVDTDESGSFAYVVAMTDSSGVISHGATNTSDTITLKLVGYIR